MSLAVILAKWPVMTKIRENRLSPLVVRLCHDLMMFAGRNKPKRIAIRDLNFQHDIFSSRYIAGKVTFQRGFARKKPGREKEGTKNMDVTINGEPAAIPAQTATPTIAQLVTARQLIPANLVVELNGKIIRQGDWAATIIADGDRLEFLAFVGGG